jgi:hypothetical protein
MDMSIQQSSKKIFFTIINIFKTPVFVTIIYFVQYRFFIFNSQFTSLTKTFGTNHPDGYYIISIIYQNILNIKNHNLYSVTGDHFTWYNNIIATTAHMYALTPVFWIVDYFAKSPITSINIVYFLQLFVLQFGIFHLVNYYTKNKILALLTSLLLPLGSSIVGISYGYHLHVNLYAGLIWMIYFSERLFRSQSKYQSYLLTVGVLFSYLFNVFSDWYVAVFSHFFIIPYFIGIFIINKKSILKNKINIKLFIVAILSPLLILTPLAISTYKTSKIFNTERSTYEIAINQKSFNNFNNTLGIGSIFGSAVENIYPRLPSQKTQEDRIALAAEFSQPNILFPDLVTVVIFWLSIALLFLGYKEKNREKRIRLRVLIFILVLSLIISFGPYLVLNSKITYIKLPYYYIFKLFFPLKAIRYIYRIQSISYLSSLLILSIYVENALLFFSKKSVNNNSKFNAFKVSLVLITLFCIVFSIQSRKQTRIVTEPQRYDLGIDSIISSENQGQKELNFFYWGKDFYDTNSINLFTSYHNYNRGFRELNWVTSGIAGLSPFYDGILQSHVTNKLNSGLIVRTIAGSETDLVIANTENLSKLEDLEISKHYKNIGESEDKKYRVYKLFNPTKNLDNWNELDFNSTISKFQTNNTPIFVTLNTVNKNESKVYTKPNKNNFENYVMEIIKDNKVIKTEKLDMIQPGFLWPSFGISQTFSIKNNLKNGDYKIEISKNGVVINTKNFTVISNQEYKNKLRSATDFKIESKQINLNNNFNLPNIVVPFQSEFKIKDGVLNNYPQKTDLQPNNNIVFFNVNNKNEKLDLSQVYNPHICKLEGNYFPEDEINMSCLARTTSDINFNYYETFILKNTFKPIN